VSFSSDDNKHHVFKSRISTTSLELDVEVVVVEVVVEVLLPGDNVVATVSVDFSVYMPAFEADVGDVLSLLRFLILQDVNFIVINTSAFIHSMKEKK
jgi:hypothetical protein